MASKRSTKLPLLRADRLERLVSGRLPSHGALTLPTARVDSYNLDITYEGQRLAAHTNKRALKAAVERWRRTARLSGDDPFGKRHSMKIAKKELDAALASDDCQARCIVLGAIQEFAASLALLVERFLLVRGWRDTERIVVGGGLRASATGELIIRRAQALLHDQGMGVELLPISNHPHEAALLGAAHLVPTSTLSGHDAILAADIGGTNLRVGVVQLNLKKARDLSKAKVWKRVVWRHADHRVGRDDVVRTMSRLMKRLIKKADAKGLRVAPYLGIACPGLIGPDGSIGSGSEVLPGNWRSPHFNLPALLSKAIPSIAGQESIVILHNDAVVQGLSEIPHLGSCRRWGIFTVGTGLGNARFTLA